MKKLKLKDLKNKAYLIRNSVIDVSVKNGAGHIAPSLSCIEILTALYYNIMNVSKDTLWESRDRLVFSKAHGCYGLYAILADIGYIKKSYWQKFYIASPLSGCVERNLKYGIEASCGSLGHGLPQAVGMAFGLKLKKSKSKVYCVVGDGELQEGSNWEAIQVAVKHKLNNLIVIIDKNGLQAMDFLDNVLTPKGRHDDLKLKFKGFGCNVLKCDGHNINSIITSIQKFKTNKSSPNVLIADTVKGQGLKCMENVPKFHFRVPNDEELGY